jgi:hypothetical protein
MRLIISGRERLSPPMAKLPGSFAGPASMSGHRCPIIDSFGKSPAAVENAVPR